MLKSAGDKLYTELSKTSFKPLKAKVFANYTGKPYDAGTDIADCLKMQVFSTVLWYNCMTGMDTQGVDLYLELGPGNTLAGMIKKVNKDANVISVNKPEDFEKALHLIK